MGLLTTVGVYDTYGFYVCITHMGLLYKCKCVLYIWVFLQLYVCITLTTVCVYCNTLQHTIIELYRVAQTRRMPYL